MKYLHIILLLIFRTTLQGGPIDAVNPLLPNTANSISSQKLNQVMTDDSSYLKNNLNDYADESVISRMADNPELDRNNGRVQIMDNYDLQFTDDIKMIIQNVLNYRKSFNRSKTIYKLQSQNSYFFSSKYENAANDPRSGRPINSMLSNNLITNVPRRLRDHSYDGEDQIKDVERIRDKILHSMSPRDYQDSGFDEITKSFRMDTMYDLKKNDDSIGGLFEKTTKMNRKLV